MIPEQREFSVCDRWIVRNINMARCDAFDALFLCNYSKDSGYPIVSPEIRGYIVGAHHFADLACKAYIDEFGYERYLSHLGNPIYGLPLKIGGHVAFGQYAG